MKLKTLIMTTVLLPIASFADTKITIDVNGLVCDFCAQAVEKVFVDLNGATSAKVDLDAAKVELCFPEGVELMTDEEFFKDMEAAGYTATAIQREQSC